MESAYLALCTTQARLVARQELRASALGARWEGHERHVTLAWLRAYFFFRNYFHKAPLYSLFGVKWTIYTHRDRVKMYKHLIEISSALNRH